MKDRLNTLLIVTPEGVSFALNLAGPVTRCIALVIDILCISMITSTLGSLIGVMGLVSADFAVALNIFIYFVVTLGYNILLEWLWRGQTVGKQLLGLQVVDAEGMTLRFSQIVIRNLLRSIDLLPAAYLLGGIFVCFTRNVQRIGDIAANTIVVRHPRIREPEVDQLFADRFNSLSSQPHLAARLRLKTDSHLATLALQALLRKNEFESESRVIVFRALETEFKKLVQFPEEITCGLSPEQYVRNIVEILYKKT